MVGARNKNGAIRLFFGAINSWKFVRLLANLNSNYRA